MDERNDVSDTDAPPAVQESESDDLDAPPAVQESESDHLEAEAEAPPTLVSAPPLEKTDFSSWDEFHAYLADYQQRTFQVYSVRTGTPVSTRNNRIREKYTKRGQEVPPGELLPEEMGTYSKAVVCTHHGRPRSRSKGLRRQQSRAIDCKAQITLVLKQNYTSGEWLVHVSSHTTQHNHTLSNGLYRSHPRVRRVTDPNVLHTVQALEKAHVKPSRILGYIRENTDKQVTTRDVHNLLASLRKSPPPVPRPVTTPAPRVAAPAPARAAAPAVAPPPRPIPHPSALPGLAQFSIRRNGPPPSATREKPTQYGKFLASFNVGKRISELMAEMEPDYFARCFSGLEKFLQIAECGRVPIVTAREAVEHVQNNVLPCIPSTPTPQQPQQTFHLSTSNIAAAASVLNGSTTAANGEATHSLISPQ